MSPGVPVIPFLEASVTLGKRKPSFVLTSSNNTEAVVAEVAPITIVPVADS
jgi:hypothetical protein